MRTDPKPADAWWDTIDQEWVHGERDAEGQLVGEVRYWNADGDLISTAEHVAGKPHGIARRYYKNGEIAQDSRYVDGKIHGERHYRRPSDPTITADGQLARCPANIATHVCHYEHGDLIGQRYFDTAGVELDSNGRAVPPRPPNIPTTAFCINEQGWFWSRRRGENGEQRIESREWFMNGEPRRENDDVTGAERAYYDNGVMRYDGARNIAGGSRHMVGEWRYYDRDGRLHRLEHRDPTRATGKKVRDRWYREGGSREGAVDGIEVGVWIVRDAADAVIAEIDLGTKIGDGALLEHAVCADELDDEVRPANDRSVIAMLARARRAGTARDPAELELDEGPAWHSFDDEGVVIPLVARQSSDPLVEHLAAMRWGPPDAALLSAIADLLFRNDRAAAALDVIDAALAVQPDEGWHRGRATYLRALGRTDEADVALPRPDKLDDRALALLAEIRANPDDDAPRLVFADQVATQFPEHAALIVAQCTGHDDGELLRAVRATVPEWLHDRAFVRGFFDDLFYYDAEQFVGWDLDLLYRLGPSCIRVDLSFASMHIAALVTLPGMRRYRELSFSDTSLGPLQIEQLGSCPYFDNLEYLGLHGTGLGDEDLEQLAEATGLPKLTRLNLHCSREDMDYTLAGIRALVGASFAPRLESLDLVGRWLGDELIDVIAQFPALTSVDLSRNELTDAVVPALIQRPFTSLGLASNNFTDAGKRALTDHFGERVRF